MKETNAVIERVREVNPDFQRLDLALEEPLGRIKPGHTVLAQTNTIRHPYLREHWWPVNIRKDYLIVERPIAEVYQPAQVVNLLGYVGQPFRFRKNLRNVLLLAYDTPPTPLLMMIPWLLGNNVSVTMALTGSGRRYMTRHLDERVEIRRSEGDDLQWPDQVMIAGWADQVFVVVDEDDETGNFLKVFDHFQEMRSTVAPNYLFGVFRPTLPCGAGACHACMMPTKKGMVMVCTDGPAFDLTQLIR
jgi:hypothetical protein